MRPEKGKLWETVWNQMTSASPVALVGISDSLFPYIGASLLCLFLWSNGELAVYGGCWVCHAPPGGCSNLGNKYPVVPGYQWFLYSWPAVWQCECRYPSVWFWVCPRSRYPLQTLVPSYAAIYASLMG